MTSALLLAAILLACSAMHERSARAAARRAETEAVSERLRADSLAVALHEAKAAGCALTYCGDFYADDATCGGAYR